MKKRRKQVIFNITTQLAKKNAQMYRRKKLECTKILIVFYVGCGVRGYFFFFCIDILYRIGFFYDYIYYFYL